jgi:hypothetical protein
MLEGRNLSLDPSFTPVAVVNGNLVEVLSRGPAHVSLLLDNSLPLSSENEIVVTFDQFAVMKVNVRA